MYMLYDYQETVRIGDTNINVKQHIITDLHYGITLAFKSHC